MNAAALESGALVGFVLGLVGGGGSILATPLMLYFVGVPSAHIAIGTSAVAVSLNAFANLIVHARRGRVWWVCAGVFAIFGVGGAAVGARVGLAVEGKTLLFGFGLVMLAVGLSRLRRRPEPIAGSRRIGRRMCAYAGAGALAAGGASGFFGIGGGFLIVPTLQAATGMSTLDAIGSSLLAVGAFGATTALAYASRGLVDWPLAAQFMLAGVAGGLAGASAATRLAGAKRALDFVFAGLVIAVALFILARNAPISFYRGG